MKRYHTVSTKVTAAERDWLLKQAAKAGTSAYAFNRQKLLADYTSSDALTLVAAELRAIRGIFLQVMTLFVTRQPITEQVLRQIVSAADDTKYERADEAISALVRTQQQGAA